MTDEFITLSSKVDFREERHREKDPSYFTAWKREWLRHVQRSEPRGESAVLVRYDRDLDSALDREWQKRWNDFGFPTK